MKLVRDEDEEFSDSPMLVDPHFPDLVWYLEVWFIGEKLEIDLCYTNQGPDLTEENNVWSQLYIGLN